MIHIAFIEKDFITPLVEFIKSCPFLDPNDVDIAQFQDLGANYEGNAIEYTGTSKPTTLKNIYNTRYEMSLQDNFIIILKRRNRSNAYRLNTSNFMKNLIRWIRYQDLFGNPPRFGDLGTETLWADGGDSLGATENEDFSLYRLQLHIEYTEAYDPEYELSTQ